MPKDDISKPRKAQAPTLAIDDADDEVIDLLEVVKPGRKVKQDADNDDRDFGADLDAMLDGLSEAGENSSSPHISDEPAPFPDPTPVDHKVDHNETLDLPGMDDLDGLDLEDRDPDLPETAVSKPAQQFQPEADQAITPSPVNGEAPASRFDEVDLNELDALLDDMLATAPASGPGPASAAANGQSANGQPAPDSPTEPQPADAGMPGAAVAAIPPDMAEAMRDQMDGQEHAMQEMRVQLAGQDAALKEQGDKLQGLQDEFAALSTGLGEQREQCAGCEAEVRDLAQRLAECGDRLQTLEQQGNGAPEETPAEVPAQAEDEDRLAEYSAEVQELVQRFSDSSDRVQSLENSLSEHVAEMQDLVQRFSGSCDQIQALEQRLDTLAAAPGGTGPAAPETADSGALDGRIQQLEGQLAEQNARCEALETQVADLLANMDKLAAETAARVIREELAALMESMA